MTDQSDTFRDLLTSHDTEFIFAQFVDMHGKPCAKLIPSTHSDALLKNGAGFAGFAAGAIGQLPNDPDLEAMPDLSSFTRLPWRPEMARVACDIHVAGKPWPYCPRTILRNVIKRAADMGLEFKIGIELEYFLLRRNSNGELEVADDQDNLQQPCYDLRALTRNLDFVQDVARNLDVLGWDGYATDHEDANGQFEQNFGFAEALTTCDRAIFFRYMVESMAHERGLLATFMPKPFAHLTGNGCHIHMSLWDDNRNLFEAESDDDPRGLGLSDLAYQFIGGLKAHANAYTAITAPTVNSYKRLVTNSQSGSSWAPVHVSYGANNRTQMLRVPGPGRIEDRSVDGACNPYLGVAAILASGLDGIENELDPGDPTSDLNLHALSEGELDDIGIDRLPANLLDAIRALADDVVLRGAFGRGRDEDYVDYFVRVKQNEWDQVHSQVTPWELENYLQLF